MTTYQDILDKLKQSQLMQKFNANKQAMTNPQPSGFGHGIANLGMKMSQSQVPQIAKLGVGTQTLGNKLGALGAAKGLGNTGAIGGASALGKATPFLGGAMSGAQAAQDASKGDYIGAGLNGIAAGASFVPGVGTAVSMGAQALDSINKMFRGAKDRANQQAMQRSMQEAQNSEQANAESAAQLQNQFANDSMQYANAMTQPSTYDGIMSRIQPVGNAGSPTGFATDINLPNEQETLQNDQSTQPQVEDINGNVSAFPTTREGFAKSLTDNGWQQDIVNAALQGLNGGNKDIADYITAYNNNAADGQQIAIPQTDEEVELARNGQFYQPEQPNTAANATKESLFERIKNGLGQFKAGYDDNSTTGFTDGDLANKLSGNVQQPVIAQNGTLTGGAATTKKTIMNRLGEAAGTGRRLMANPWVQAGIAAAISKADGGDVGDMAQAAYKYGTAKAMSDQYYRQLHPGAKVMPVLNTYGVDDYKAKAYNDFNQGRTVMSRRDLIKLQNPTMSDQDIEDLITKSGINGDELVSIKGYETVEKAKNNTRKTDIQEDKNKWQRDQGQQKIGIQQQKVNNTKINNDRNYQLKLKAAQDKVSKSDLKEQTKQELNRNLAKYSTIINDPNRSDDDKAKARQGMINTYGKDFLSVEANL